MTSFGFIRWDAFYVMDSSGVQPAASLGPEEFHSRAPLHATLGRNKVTWNPTQETMDSEIESAEAAGVYWAFLRYDHVGLSTGFTLFQSSSIKGNINWCSMHQSSTLGSTGNYASKVSTIVAEMQQSNYQKVLTTRPLFYLYYTASDIATYWGGSIANLKTALDALRTAVLAAGLGNPYIVALVGTDTATATALGANAISRYYAPIPTGVNVPYTTLDTDTRAYWASLVATGAKVVPIAMIGWNRLPRIQRPVVWEIATQKPYIGASKVVTLPTAGEITTHLEAAVAFLGANASACEADTVLSYAWNEFDEGGWIAPTYGDPTGLKCAAVAAALT